MWSKNSSITEQTESTIPGAPPATNKGSFEIVSCEGERKRQCRNVFVYWQQIPNEIRNGENLSYIVTVNDTSIVMEEKTNSYAKFKNLVYDRSYKFSISSKNAVGISTRESIVIVPTEGQTIAEPVGFSKLAYNRSGSYGLDWKPPKGPTRHKVKSYTIFWCTNKNERPFQCTVSIFFLINHNKPPDKILQLHLFIIKTHALVKASSVCMMSLTFCIMF